MWAWPTRILVRFCAAAVAEVNVTSWLSYEKSFHRECCMFGIRWWCGARVVFPVSDSKNVYVCINFVVCRLHVTSACTHEWGICSALYGQCSWCVDHIHVCRFTMIKAELYVLFGGSVWKVRRGVFEGVSWRDSWKWSVISIRCDIRYRYSIV